MGYREEADSIAFALRLGLSAEMEAEVELSQEQIEWVSAWLASEGYGKLPWLR